MRTYKDLSKREKEIYDAANDTAAAIDAEVGKIVCNAIDAIGKVHQTTSNVAYDAAVKIKKLLLEN